MSLKMSGNDEGNELSRRLNGSYASSFGEKHILNSHAGILDGGSSLQFSVDQGFLGVSIENIEKVNGFEKMEKKNGSANIQKLEKIEKPNGMKKINMMKSDKLDSENQQKQALQDDILPHWGQRKRSRCSRPEIKQATEESPLPVEETTQMERQVMDLKKQRPVVGQDHTAVQSSMHSLRHPAQKARQIGSSSARRNVHDLLLRGISVGNKNNTLSSMKYSIPSVTERPSRRTSPAPRNTSSACPLDAENTSAVNRPSMPASDFEHCAIQSILFTPWRVDHDSFEWPKINVSLSRKEKEDDFMVIKGCKMPQRPRRRPKLMEKAIHYCTPGNWLSDLNRGRYDVREKKCVKKKPRGLKAMESSDSESE